jgi:biopolymer transport protein ExbB
MLAGGWCMIPIIVCSILGLALLMERAWYWLVLRLGRDDELRGELLTLTIDRQKLERTRDPVCRVVAQLLKHPEDATAATSLAESVLRETKTVLPVLNMIAGVSCSLGLFGTVLGVSLAFEAMAKSQAQELALALAVALNTTVLGLVVYLPVYIGSTICNTLTSRLSFQIEQALNTVNLRLRKESLGRVTVTS